MSPAILPITVGIRFMPRPLIVLLVVFVVAIAAGAGLLLRSGDFQTVNIGTPAGPDVAAVAPDAQAPEPAQTAVPAEPATPPAGATASATAPENAPAAASAVPSFDIVRVEEDGAALVAGRSAPGTEVEVLSGDKVIARATADAEGNFVALPEEPLPPGEHMLSLRRAGEAAVPAGEQVAVVVLDPKAAKDTSVAEAPAAAQPEDMQVAEASPAATAPAADTETTVAASDAKPVPAETTVAEAPTAEQPEQPSTKPVETAAAEPKQAPEAVAEAAPSAEPAETAVAAAPSVPGAPAAAPQPQLSVQAVETEGDKLFVAGAAKPDALVRVYADNSLLGEVRAGEGGHWLLETNREMPAGETTIRAEEVAQGGLNLVASVEAPFIRSLSKDALVPASEAMAGGAASVAESGAIGGPQVVIIRRGDNLWRISRRSYGKGIRYQTIYTANRDQIRNPHRIYPGQVFVMPTRDRSWDAHAASTKTP